jgi:hypothetical protein
MINPFEVALEHAPDASLDLAAFLTEHAKRWKKSPRWHQSTNPFRQCAALGATALVGRPSLRQEISNYISFYDCKEREANDSHSYVP